MIDVDGTIVNNGNTWGDFAVTESGAIPESYELANDIALVRSVADNTSDGGFFSNASSIGTDISKVMGGVADFGKSIFGMWQGIQNADLAIKMQQADYKTKKEAIASGSAASISIAKDPRQLLIYGALAVGAVFVLIKATK